VGQSIASKIGFVVYSFLLAIGLILYGLDTKRKVTGLTIHFPFEV
ncbi:21935_t:CDS:2, partial [Racocetra persica]